MKVILLRDVARIGRRFEIKEVPSGHALNFLIPRKLAEPATPENVRRVESMRQKHAATLIEETAQFTEALARLKDTTIPVSADANAQGHLFKSVREADIATALRVAGITVDVHQIELPHPIKALGTHTVALSAGTEKGNVTIEVIAK
jgi:large subunit ribosomal protein L9